MTKKRVLITGGGTGGHVYPALAVAEMLKADPDIEAILYIGHPLKIEARVVPEAGISFESVSFAGMPRSKNPFALLLWLVMLVGAFIRAHAIVSRFKPHVALGTGGYVSAPVLFAALSCGVPYVVHEPDAHPGLVNQLMSRWASASSCAFDAARSSLKSPYVCHTGNPLRSQIGGLSRSDALARLGWDMSFSKPILLVMGGSLGAQKINRALIEIIQTLVLDLDWCVVHQTGERDFEATAELCPEVFRDHPQYRLLPFIKDMPAYLSLATLAVSRAGSMSLSELFQAEVPAVLIPYPLAAADHQRKNALAAEAAGAAVMIDDAALTGPVLRHTLKELMADPVRLETMRVAARQQAKPHATSDIVGLLKQVWR